MRIDPIELTRVGEDCDSKLINQIAGEVLADPMLMQTLGEMVLKLMENDLRNQRDRNGMHRRLNG
ncbi:hypothetical protein ACKFKF_07825 [Phormidesmis sp. 146-12]